MALLGCMVLGTAVAAVPAHKPQPLTKQAYQAEKARIDAQYQGNRKLCAATKGHAQDVCEAEATGRRKALQAELDARFQPSPDAEQKAKKVTADANFDVAKVKCDAFKDQAKKRCLAEAKDAREAAIRQAKVEKVEETGGPFGGAGHRKGAS